MRLCITWLWKLPQEILVVLLISYRAAISPLYGQVCRFFPSCSAYALEAVTVYGAAKGSWLAIRRLIRCHPWNSGGVDHVPHHGKNWPAEKLPKIMMLNHPVIPADEDGRTAA